MCRYCFILLLFSTSSVWAAFDLSTLPDPTQPVSLKQKTLKKVTPETVVKKIVKREPIKLSSILISPNRKIAIINQKLVKIGDTVSGVKVLKINPNYVKISRRGRISKLYLQITAIKKMTMVGRHHDAK